MGNCCGALQNHTEYSSDSSSDLSEDINPRQVSKRPPPLPSRFSRHRSRQSSGDDTDDEEEEQALKECTDWNQRFN